MSASAATSLIILGGPDAGKSNYIGALWMRLQNRKGLYRLAEEPKNIEYVESIVGHLWQGNYPPRSEPDEGETTFTATIARAEAPKTPVAQLRVPDLKGEIWKKAAKEREIDPVWIQQLRDSRAAMLFVRFGSEEFVEMLDWVASADLMAMEDGEDDGKKGETPTQVFLCDLLNLIEEHLGCDTDVQCPRVAMVIAAWDVVGAPEREPGPERFIKDNYPMLHGRLADSSRIELRAFGVSATGFDLKTENGKAAYLECGPADAGFSETEIEQKILKEDLLAPLAWALEGAND